MVRAQTSSMSRRTKSGGRPSSEKSVVQHPRYKGRGRHEKGAEPSSRQTSFVRLADWKAGQTLGQGHFGIVVKANNLRTHQVVAWKRFPTPRLLAAAKQGGRVLELLEREIQIHQR